MATTDAPNTSLTYKIIQDFLTSLSKLTEFDKSTLLKLKKIAEEDKFTDEISVIKTIKNIDDSDENS